MSKIYVCNVLIDVKLVLMKNNVNNVHLLEQAIYVNATQDISKT